MKLAALPIVLLIAPLGAACTASPGRPGAATASADAPIPFVENDYDGALAQAKASGKPLFVDAWAPWCHTCLSMRSYVFTDPLLRARAGDFVWLSLDTERASSARFLEAFPMQVWPTLWVIDAKTVKPALKWLGSATPSEMADLLDDARSAIEHGDLGGEAAAAFERGNRATAEGKRDDAMREYRAALAVASPAWPRRGRVVEALVARLSEMQQNEACAELAASELPKLPAGTAVANVALSGIDCARHAEGGRAKALAPGLAQAAERLAVDDTLPILADDRSGLFEALVDYYKDEGRLTDVRVLALKWSEFLEGQASRASDAAARAVFDAHRLLAYLALGEPDKALPMLAESEREFPSDYNPPARIARVYLEMKRYDEALAAATRALTRGYGPRKVRLFFLKADALSGKGDGAGALATLREAAAYAKTLPAAELQPRLTAELEKRLSEASTR